MMIFKKAIPRRTFLRGAGAALALPFLSGIPVVGHIFFSLNPYFYLAVGFVAFFSYMIYRTRWGLRLRASGEQPSAAGTVGVDVIMPVGVTVLMIVAMVMMVAVPGAISVNVVMLMVMSVIV